VISDFARFLPDEFHRVTEPQLVNDHWPFQLRHPPANPKAVAISRRLRPSARRRLISSCLSTVSFLRAIPASPVRVVARRLLDCDVSGPRARVWEGDGGMADGRRQTRSGRNPDRGTPGKTDPSALHRRFRSWSPNERRKTRAAQDRKAAPASGPHWDDIGWVHYPRNRGGPIPMKSGGSFPHEILHLPHALRFYVLRFRRRRSALCCQSESFKSQPLLIADRTGTELPTRIRTFASSA